MNLKTLLKRDFVVFDGAMGTMLQGYGMKPGTVPETLNFEKPEWVKAVLRAYAEAGSDIVNLNTFGANRYKLANTPYSVEEIVCQAVKVGREAVEGTDTLISLDVAPVGKLMEPAGTMSFEEAYDIFKEIALAGAKTDVDCVTLETMTDLLELKAAVLAFKENTNLPIIATMTFEKRGRTFTGCLPSAAALTLEGLGVDVIGVNCSLGPNELYDIVGEMLEYSTVPVLVKPNAGLPDPETGEFPLGPEEFAVQMQRYKEMGCKLFGGCCGTTPDTIRALRKMLDSAVSANPQEGQKTQAARLYGKAAVCSSRGVVVIDGPRIIGERINPTGKKLFKEALKKGDMDYILTQGIEQVEAGAEILDVNVGLPEINEKEMLVATVKSLQGILDAPLQLDTTDKEALEAALRVYDGKPIVNSVNGDEESLAAVLPLVKKYGAAVVGLTLDKNGIPKTADERVAIARRILDRALALGIRREDVYIDCLTLTVSAEPEGAADTLKALHIVKEELGLKTVLGVSNISFGLPSRELINHTFLAMALESGLDLPIINPNSAVMTGVVRAYRLLENIDKNASEFIASYAGQKTAAAGSQVAAADANGATGQKQKTSEAGSGAQAGGQASNNSQTGGLQGAGSKKAMSLEYAIRGGLKKEAAELTRALLASTSPMDIINGQLIPVLDKIGVEFEEGRLFLPQLILSADTAGVSFDVLKEELRGNGEGQQKKGTIVLATVRGDIHDIGKNIVKVLLENYGYDIIDLGKDVPEEAVLKAVQENDIKLVGLSALMTTTIGAMASTIALLREQGADCKVMVGGAVVTAEYAERIGADYYSRDAKNGVDIAKEVFV